MVFINFPTSTTSEEEALLKKYEKLQNKRRSLVKKTQPEREVVATTSQKPPEVKDAKKVIEELKKSGQLPRIFNPGQKSEFKRKVQAKPTVKMEEETRQIITYDDDLFD